MRNATPHKNTTPQGNSTPTQPTHTQFRSIQLGSAAYFLFFIYLVLLGNNKPPNKVNC